MRRLALVAILAACGSKSQPEPAKPAEHAEPEQHEMNLSPEMAKFHDVLAPRWHEPKGTHRMTATCTAMPEFQQSADALAKAAPPASGDGAAWSAGTKELTDAVTGLKAACDAVDATAFEAAFERVHKGFHGLMEHGEHHM